MLEVMTFNIRYPNRDDGLNYWKLRSRFVVDVLREKLPEVIGLQEAMRSQLDDLAKQLPEYAEVGIGRDDGKSAGEYSAILYKKSVLESTDSGTFWLSDTPEIPGSRTWHHVCPRVCTWSHFKHLPSGRSFYVFNTHWDHESEEARTKSVQLLTERIEQRKHPADPFMITGDFNCGEQSAPIQALRKSLALRDSFRIVNPQAAEVGTFHAWSGRTTEAKIDYIWVDPTMTAVEAEILHTQRDGRYPSDHFPVRAKLQLGKP
jgi:endonuclease/exonuclease/phosphatase family metal-dependent hydrolase